MARGWESKSVESQQEEANRRAAAGPAPLTEQERAGLQRRGTLELARARALGDLQRARSSAHKQMLQRTIEAIELELRTLGARPKGH